VGPAGCNTKHRIVAIKIRSVSDGSRAGVGPRGLEHEAADCRDQDPERKRRQPRGLGPAGCNTKHRIVAITIRSVSDGSRAGVGPREG